MKNKILFALAISTCHTSFTMEYIKKFFANFATQTPPTEIQKLNLQINELVKISKALSLTTEATFAAYAKNSKKFKTNNGFMWAGGSGIGDHSQSIDIQLIEFDLSEQNGVMQFSIKNMLDQGAELGKFTLDKKLYDDTTANLLYSHLVDSFDALIIALDKSQKGFVDRLKDSDTAQKYPATVKNLKPENIEPSKSLEEAFKRLNEVIQSQGNKIISKVKEIEEARKNTSKQEDTI